LLQASQPSIFGHTTHLQKPHNAGSRREARFFNTLLKGEIVPDGFGKPINVTNDPRVTKVGRILRKTSLDELSQLIDILNPSIYASVEI
jgi:lipopolysaccharide/colanic/teichoic acid biosynthesis glycosyltransferase